MELTAGHYPLRMLQTKAHIQRPASASDSALQPQIKSTFRGHFHGSAGRLSVFSSVDLHVWFFFKHFATERRTGE